MKLRHTLLTAIFAIFASSAQAANICLTSAVVPGGTCDSTVTTIAAALTAANYGDTIWLHAGTTYNGHWSLPNKGAGSSYITIRSDTADSLLPAAGVRLDPDRNPALLPLLAHITSDTTSAPTFRTAASAHHWRFRFLDVANVQQGYQEIFWVGGNDCVVTPGFCQEYESQEPTDIEFDRVFVHGDKIAGQKKGWTVGGKNISIHDSTCIDIAGLGQDSNCIGGANGHGPISIINNRLESSTENIMFGGDDPAETTFMVVTGTPTATSASVTVQPGRVSTNPHTLSELKVGQLVAVLVGGGTDRQFTILRTISGTGTTGSITFDPLTVAPDVPGDIRGGVVIKGVTVRNNYITKPLRWLNPIVDTAANPTVSVTTTSGTLAAGTYYYTIQAINKNGYTGNTVYSKPASEVSATLSATGSVVLSWDPSPTASHYRIYGRATGAPTAYWEVAVGTNTFTDTGAAGTAATTISKPSYWQLKNLFEIKAAQNVQVDSNLFEYQWAGSDIGYAFWFKSVNQGLRCEFCQSRDIVFEKNLVRHVDGFFEISGSEFIGGTNADRVAPLTNLTVRNNLLYDSNSSYAVQKGVAATGTYAIIMSNWSVNTKVDHNTLVHTSRGFLSLNGKAHDNLQITNNLGRKETYGVLGSGSQEGTTSLTTYTTSYTFTGNAIAGITTSKYPAGNFGPTVVAWEGEFENYTFNGAPDADGPADYHLRVDSTYHNAGTDGKDVGADVTLVLAATATAFSGGGAAPAAVPPTITTTTLTTGTVGADYNDSLSGSGTGALTWAVTSGTLPTGLSLTGSTGAIGGTPTVAGTSTFSVTVTDAGTGLTATQTLSITIAASFIPVSIATTSPLPNATVAVPYSLQLTASDGKPPYTWALTGGAFPTGFTLSSTGLITGTATTIGTFSPVITVTGVAGSSASRTFAFAVVADTPIPGRPVIIGPIPNAVAHFSGPIAPTLSTEGCCKLGDEWTDTSKNPAVKNQATSLAPLTWTFYGGGAGGTHALLSTTHTDTVPDTPQTGDLIVFNGDAWARVGIGGVGSVLTSDGTGAGWAAPNGNLPETVNVTTRVNAPIVGVSNYVAFTPVDSPGCSALNFGRLYLDKADNHYKVCEGAGGTPIQIGSGTSGTTHPSNFVLETRGSASTQWNAMPAALTEFNSSTGNRVPADLTGYTQARLYLKVFTAATTGALCYPQWSSDKTTWTALDGATGPSLPIDVAGGDNQSAWVTLAAGVKADGWIRLVCQGGNATLNPTFGNIVVQVK